MRRFGKWLGRAILGLILLGIALWLFGPREDVTLDFRFDPAVFGADIDGYFADREARFDNITPGAQKRIRWVGNSGTKTTLALVYLHGFSASAPEMRPVPDLLADALDANLVYTRLQGHGRDGNAMAGGTVRGWARDVAEAIHAGRAVGDKVVIISSSTGGTLAAAAALHPELMRDVSGIIFVSPNFGLNTPLEPALTWPAARAWLPRLAGQERRWEPANEAQATYWTYAYPSVAVLPMAALVKEVSSRDFSVVDVPALFWFSKDDRVVRAPATEHIARKWGGPVEAVMPNLTAADDPYAHNVVGEILSPNQTEPAFAAMLDWIERKQ